MKMSLAGLEDLPRIMELVDAAKDFMHRHNNFQWDHEYPLQDTFEKDIINQDLYVFKERDIIESFICINKDIPSEYMPLKWTTGTNCLVIHRMVTNTSLMGKGLAQKMVAFAIEKAKNEDYQSVWTDTNSKNKGALHLFEKLGFQFVGHITLREKPDLFCCYELGL